MNILTKCKLIVKEEKNHGTVPLRRLVFDQISPVHPVSESRGGELECDVEGGGGGAPEKKILCLILD